MSGSQQPPATTPSGITEAEVVSGEAKAMPKDAQVVAAILNDMGMTEYEPRVVTQLLEL